jgi:hypothetical protein
MKRLASLVAAASLLGTTLVSGSGTGFASARSAGRSTPFAFKATGFGTRVIGGQVPVGSSQTGFRVISCTTRAGEDRTNDVATASLPGLGQASGVRTHVWTSDRRGVAASHSSHSIAHVSLASGDLGSLTLDAVKATATASHSASGFHATSRTFVGGITFTPATGPAQSFPAPTPDQPVTIPGLARISLGKNTAHHTTHGATASAMALRVDVIPTHTSVLVARAHAELYDGMTGGIFSGRSAATHVITAAGGIVTSGPNPLTAMPCQGTFGTTRGKALASVDLGGQLVVKGATSRERASQRGGRAHGYEQGGVARLDLGKGQLIVDAIVGRANVTRTSRGVATSARGTHLGRITASGQRLTFPPTGVLEVPGVAKLERRVVTHRPDGISVVALRLTLLDGSGAVVDLGEARLQIDRLPH